VIRRDTIAAGGSTDAIAGFGAIAEGCSAIARDRGDLSAFFWIWRFAKDINMIKHISLASRDVL
jgi:hypothetical protein